MRNRKLFALIALGTCTLLAACGQDSDRQEVAAESDPTSAPLYEELPQAIKDQGYLTFAGDSHPPYRTVESGGGVTGIDPEFQELLEQEIGVEIRTEITAGLPAILQGMQSGRYDAFNGPVRTSAEREADFDSVVWMTTRTSYVFPKEDAGGLSDSEDLCGLRVAGTAGSVTETQVQRLNEWCAEQGRPANEFIGLADTNATILAVQSDRADTLAVTETAALDIVQQTPDTFEYLTQTDEQGAGIDQMAMLAPKGTGVGEVLFKATQNIFNDGRYEEFMAKWGMETIAVEEPLYNPATAGK